MRAGRRRPAPDHRQPAPTTILDLRVRTHLEDDQVRGRLPDSPDKALPPPTPPSLRLVPYAPQLRRPGEATRGPAGSMGEDLRGTRPSDGQPTGASIDRDHVADERQTTTPGWGEAAPQVLPALCAQRGRLIGDRSPVPP
jgi:hypothetical protein